ncbi:MAG: YdeI/OmpD-associated family protein [Ignavibacteria bacterium]|nr:YdeI/OmpD-associated family protein [Ignavibacteria bacterium]
MSKEFSFSAIIKEGIGGGAYVEIPFDVKSEFGKSRVKVLAHIDGIEYRGSLIKMKTTCHILGILKEIRGSLEKTIGDTVQIDLREDTFPRIVEIPGDVQLALQNNPEIEEYFHSLAYTHKREYVSWINSAKKDATRAARLVKMMELLYKSYKSK